MIVYLSVTIARGRWGRIEREDSFAPVQKDSARVHESREIAGLNSSVILVQSASSTAENIHRASGQQDDNHHRKQSLQQHQHLRRACQWIGISGTESGGPGERQEEVVGETRHPAANIAVCLLRKHKIRRRVASRVALRRPAAIDLPVPQAKGEDIGQSKRQHPEKNESEGTNRLVGEAAFSDERKSHWQQKERLDEQQQPAGADQQLLGQKRIEHSHSEDTQDSLPVEHSMQAKLIWGRYRCRVLCGMLI